MRPVDLASFARPDWADQDEDHLAAETCRGAYQVGWCARHAGILAVMTVFAARADRAARGALPGTAWLGTAEISEPPYEEFTGSVGRYQSAALAAALALVSGSELVARVEVDAGRRRSRTVIGVAGSPRTTVLASPRLARGRAADLARKIRGGGRG